MSQPPPTSTVDQPPPAPAEEAHVAEAESKWVSPEEEEFAEIDRTSRVVWEGEGGVRVTLEAHASRSHHTGLRLRREGW